MPRTLTAVPRGSESPGRAVIPFRTTSTISRPRELSPTHAASPSSLPPLAHAIVHADQRGPSAYLSQLRGLSLARSPMPCYPARAATSACTPSNPTCPQTVSAGHAIRYVSEAIRSRTARTHLDHSSTRPKCPRRQGRRPLLDVFDCEWVPSPRARLCSPSSHSCDVDRKAMAYDRPR